MTVAEMIAQRTEKLSDIKDSSNAAVTAKGGTPADDLSGLPAAIVSIPTGSELPELTDPAAAGDVIAGKEYINGAGAIQEGTLVVCDTVAVVETVGSSGVGVNVEIESTAQGGSAILTLPETNLLPDNIASGVNIFGVLGSAKKLRIESGTITPAEDMTTLSVPCSSNPKYAVIVTTPENTANGDIIGAVIYNINYDGLFAGNCIISYYYSSKIRGNMSVAALGDGITMPGISSCFYRAGTAYQWTAYFWEDT